MSEGTCEAGVITVPGPRRQVGRRAGVPAGGSAGDERAALARQLAADARGALGRLRVSWPWLAELVVPGVGPPVRRRLDDRQILAEARNARRDREAAVTALSGGAGPDVARSLATRGTPSVPMGGHADAARLVAITARAEIAAAVRDLLDELWTAARGETPLPTLPDPLARAVTTRCGWCSGGIVVMPAGWAWAWPDEALVCSRCEGRGTVPTGTACAVCATVGPCGCDTADAVMALALRLLGPLLTDLRDPDQAGEASRILDRADARARRLAGVVDDRRPLRAPCPACGHRDLEVEVSSPDESEWYAACANRGCSCAGAGCSCGRPVRYAGRRHRWPVEEWFGTDGFAARIGVDLPTLLALGRATRAKGVRA